MSRGVDHPKSAIDAPTKTPVATPNRPSSFVLFVVAFLGGVGAARFVVHRLSPTSSSRHEKSHASRHEHAARTNRVEVREAAPDTESGRDAPVEASSLTSTADVERDGDEPTARNFGATSTASDFAHPIRWREGGCGTHFLHQSRFTVVDGRLDPTLAEAHARRAVERAKRSTEESFRRSERVGPEPWREARFQVVACLGATGRRPSAIVGRDYFAPATINRSIDWYISRLRSKEVPEVRSWQRDDARRLIDDHVAHERVLLTRLAKKTLDAVNDATFEIEGAAYAVFDNRLYVFSSRDSPELAKALTSVRPIMQLANEVRTILDN